MKRIAVIPGDGIGPEVIREAVRVLKHLGETRDLQLKFVDFDWGADKFLNEVDSAIVLHNCQGPHVKNSQGVIPARA